ncbi:VOC family protein [Candidatus Giovannonibacteria bacterium]|nr:VOC family protein [Candidatus Giovannonibacteria bacterium]
MIAHVTIHVNDFEKGKEFYSKALAPLGYKLTKDFPQWKAAGFVSGEGNTDFWLHADGAKQPTHIAFTATSEEMAKEFYDAAIKAGGKDNGAPGYRTEYGAGYYAAFVYDPDGHNIEAMYWNDSKK